ncbi:hypothetical protein GW17_00056351 [Ensete ventricosum]|nr:hypothetical protein GW17_00056351 [Ensete ventricosum]
MGARREFARSSRKVIGSSLGAHRESFCESTNAPEHPSQCNYDPNRETTCIRHYAREQLLDAVADGCFHDDASSRN